MRTDLHAVVYRRMRSDAAIRRGAHECARTSAPSHFRRRQGARRLREDFRRRVICHEPQGRQVGDVIECVMDTPAVGATETMCIV
jgi:hypothetical protein